MKPSSSVGPVMPAERVKWPQLSPELQLQPVIAMNVGRLQDGDLLATYIQPLEILRQWLRMCQGIHDFLPKSIACLKPCQPKLVADGMFTHLENRRQLDLLQDGKGLRSSGRSVPDHTRFPLRAGRPTQFLNDFHTDSS
jgi:hypothetical protein